MLLLILVAACDDGGSDGDQGGAAGQGAEGGGVGGQGGMAMLPQCADNSACAQGELCVFEGFACGQSGVCEPLPEGCSKELRLTCGCDGMIYDNACFAKEAGVSPVPYQGTCTPPQGTMACGAGFCTIALQYCIEQVEVEHRCEPLPTSCDQDTPDCACLVGQLNVDCACFEQPSGGLLVTCL